MLQMDEKRFNVNLLSAGDVLLVEVAVKLGISKTNSEIKTV